MSRLETHTKDLYELRFSPMCKPAGEVANLTQLESHTTRGRVLMLWRIATGNLYWGPREVELLYQSTLDSITEAFDIFHYPISQIMLDARADVWDAGLVPADIKKIIETEPGNQFKTQPILHDGNTLLLAGELAQVEGQKYLHALRSILDTSGEDVQILEARCGVLPFVLGARDVAYQMANRIVEVINKSKVTNIILDGPETAWALMKIFPDLNLTLPQGVEVKLLCEYLNEKLNLTKREAGKVFVHDSRPAYFLSDCLPNYHAILPEVIEDEAHFGQGAIYDLPRSLVDLVGAERVYGQWTRGMAKSCGADDGLWLTFPELAKGLAFQRLEYARHLGAEFIVTNSPLCASFLDRVRNQDDPTVYWLPEFLL